MKLNNIQSYYVRIILLTLYITHFGEYFHIPTHCNNSIYIQSNLYEIVVNLIQKKIICNASV